MLMGKNRSGGTIQAYGTDLTQFLLYLTENDLTVHSPADVTKSHLTEYMTYLSRERALSGVSCARKLILRLCTEAGLEKKVSPHIFRHTFASMKAESGWGTRTSRRRSSTCT